MSILIRWIRQEPSNPDRHCFLKRIYSSAAWQWSGSLHKNTGNVDYGGKEIEDLA